MKIRHFASLGLLAFGFLAAAAAAPEGLDGRWKLNLDRSASIKPWSAETLVVRGAGDGVTIDRRFVWGTDRKVSDSTSVKADGRTILADPVAYWIDTWYNNAYIGADHLKRVSGEWIEPGRVLKVETRLFLNVQQGEFPVHIYDEYRVSADGRTLTLLEIRSTRDQPLTYVFTRE